MVQMLTKLKPLGRPKQPRPTPKLNNTTVRDFGGGLNVVDSEQSLTSKFSPVFDNMVTYTDRRVSPRYGYEMWLKLKTGAESSGVAQDIRLITAFQSRIAIIEWAGHPFTDTGFEHATISGWDITHNGVTPLMMNRTHGVRHVIDANNFEIILSNSATGDGPSPIESINWTKDNHLLGGEPVEAKYFANYVLVWSSIGEIIRIDREKNAQRIWSNAVAYSLPGDKTDLYHNGWTTTELVASDIFGAELICSNGRDKPLSIDFTREEGWVIYLVDTPAGESANNITVPAFDACKSAFRYFTVHDTDLSSVGEHSTEIRVAAKDTSMVYSDSSDPGDAVDVDMSKVAASPEQTVRGFAIIKDSLLVISPTASTLMKLGTMLDDGQHDPLPLDTLNGFGSNSPRTIVEIGSDVFMIDFNGVPSAKLSAISNAVVPERVSNYIESMMSSHIGRLRKELMRLKAFGFFDGKNKSVHYYLPKYDTNDKRLLTNDPFYFDSDMSQDPITQSSLILRLDDHQYEKDDFVDVSGATSISVIPETAINGRRRIIGVLNPNYILIEIGAQLPLGINVGGGGNNIVITPVVDGVIGYIYHYVPQLKLFSWSRFKTDNNLIFNCGCGTIEGRAYLFTPEGYMMRYGSPDHQIHADWFGMYDFKTWNSGQTYTVDQRVFDGSDGLVYKCLADTTVTAPTFADAREEAPDSWEEYKGEPINFAWELPWADFGARQMTKGLRFLHIDATGSAQFKCEVYADNIYKNEANGQLIPARSLTFVPNDVGAYGAGQQVYGAGRRTREQKLWQMPVKFKIVKTRMTGSTTTPLSITAISFLYHKGSVVRG